MTRPVTVPNAFQTQTGPIPLSQLDANFSALVAAANDLNSVNSYYVDSSGAPNQIVVTTPGGVGAVYSAGLQLSVKVANTNNSATVTINVNSQGAKNVVNASGTTTVVAGQLIINEIVTLIYDGTAFVMSGTGSVPFTVYAGQTVNRGLGFAFTGYPTTGIGIDTVSNGVTMVANGVVGAETTATQFTAGPVTGGFSVNSNGNVNINAPSGGQALTVAGVAGAYAAAVNGPSASGNSYGLGINAGTTSADAALTVKSQTGTTFFNINGIGNAAISAPASGVALTVSAASSSFGVYINSASGSFALAIIGTVAGTSQIAINTSATTGAQTATFAATNKPGSGTTSPDKWLPISLDGTTHYIPCWT